MNRSSILAIRRFLLRIPRQVWQQEVVRSARNARLAQKFMTREHHAVRDFAVRELPRLGEPISPLVISQRLGIEAQRLSVILDELERGMTYL